MISVGVKMDYHKKTKSERVMSEWWSKQLQAPIHHPHHIITSKSKHQLSEPSLF